MTPPPLGRIYVLNGASSAGKSSIAGAMQEQSLPAPFCRLGIDDFMHFLPQAFFAIDPEDGHPAHEGLRWILPLEPDERAAARARMHEADPSPLEKYAVLQEVLEELGFSAGVAEQGVKICCGSAADATVFAMHRAAENLSRSGFNVVMEHVFFSESWRADLRQALEGLPTVLVGVHAPLSVLEKRERDRGYRIVGQTKGHHELIHEGVDYDLRLDTSVLSPGQCASQILEFAPLK